MNKTIKYLIILVAMVMLTACAKNNRVESQAETTAEQTIEEPTTVAEIITVVETTTAAETTTEDETETEMAETVGEAIEIGKLHDTHVLSSRFDWVQEEGNPGGAFQQEPEIGETAERYLFIKEPDGDGKAKANQDTFKTVSIPKWGIYKIALDPALFPDDPDNVHYLTEDEYSWRDVTKGYMESYAGVTWEDDPYKTYGLDDSMSYVWPMFNSEPGNYIYLDADENIYKNGCYDISAAFPGSLTRKSSKAIFQTWIQDTEFMPSKDMSMTPETVFNDLYPYRKYEFMMTDGKYYVLEDEDGYTYVYMNVWVPGDFHAIKIKKGEESANYSGSVLFRIKDGKSQGFLYLSSNDPAIRYSNYVLNQTLEMMDIDRVTEGGTCADFIQEKKASNV